MNIVNRWRFVVDQRMIYISIIDKDFSQQNVYRKELVKNMATTLEEV